VLSNLADYGFGWAVLAAWKARRPGPRRQWALRTLALGGVASYAVNAGLKRLVARPRPADHLRVASPEAVPVRPPTSSSFPSGHTLAGFCTAVALAESPAEGLALVTFAGAVAASRVQLGAHHASDVVAGAAMGTVLGLAVRRAARWW